MGQLDLDGSGQRIANLGVAAFYEVQAGDTLAKIARRFGLESRVLAAANGLALSHALRIGQQLQVNGL